MTSEHLRQILQSARAALKFANEQSDTPAEIRANTVLIDALDEAARLTERNEPQVVRVAKEYDSFKQGSCPTCGRIVKSYSDVRFCSVCGQRLEW